MGSFDTVVGSVVNDVYEIIALLGEGGMGVVYKAYDRRNERFVAIKFINRERLNDPSQALRFKREVETTARLNHPFITKVHDFGLTKDAQPYLVMDFVEGKTLAAMIAEEGQLPLTETILIFTAVCDALTHAHENKVLHRDLKPSNIMINRNSGTTSIKILDFGIAKILESASTPSLHITSTGELLGSPFYMSPEQAKGGRIDHRSDLYSLGCTLYEALTGGPPHIGESPMSTLLKRESHEPLPMAEASLGRKFPEQLENIVAKLLKHDPRERYQSADDLKRDLLMVDGQSETSTKSAGAIVPEKQCPTAPESQLDKNSRRLMITASAAVLTIACAAPLVLHKWHKSTSIVHQAHETLPAPPQEYQNQMSQVASSLDLTNFKSYAMKARAAGRYEIAESYYLQAINQCASLPGNHDGEIADLRAELAFTYTLGQKYAIASRLYEQLRAYYEKSLRPDDPKLISIWYMQAITYNRRELKISHHLLEQTAQLLEKAARYYENHLPQTSKAYSDCLIEQLANFNLLANEDGKKRVLLKMLKFKTNALGEKHPETLKPLRDLGQCCRSQKRYEEAITYDKRWVAAYNDSPDKPQDDRVQSVLALASDYYELAAEKNTSLLKLAKKLYGRALNMCQQDERRFETAHGPVFERLAAIDQLLAKVGQGDLAESERLELEALKIYKRLNADKKTVAVALFRTGEIQGAEHHTADAIATYLEALRVASKAFGEKSGIVLNICWRLAETYKGNGELNEADVYYRRCLPLSAQFFGPKSNHTRSITFAWSENAMLQRDWPKAHKLLMDGLSLGPSTSRPKGQTFWAESRLKYVEDHLKSATATETSSSKATDSSK